MKRTTRAELRANNYATDITNWNHKQLSELRASGSLEKIAVSLGAYGPNGCLIIDNATGNLYKITARTSALFII